jgi:drug/metabolite transporter (DMT)-like permease
MKKGIILGFMTAIISGISVYVNGFFVTDSDPLVFAFLRNFLVAIIFSIMLIYRHEFKILKTLAQKQWFNLIAIGAIGGGLAFALFFSGLKEIGGVNANLINKSLFLWVAIGAIPFLKERLSWLAIFGYGIIFYVTFILSGSFPAITQTGSLLTLGATILWSIEYIISKNTLRTIPVGVVAWARMAIGLPFLMIAIMLTHKSNMLLATYHTAQMALIVSSILLTGYMLFWYQALSKAPATIVTSILVLAPSISLILQTFTKGKGFTTGQSVNLILVSVGIALILISPKLKKIFRRIRYGI